jgi:hypothetical protein
MVVRDHPVDSITAGRHRNFLGVVMACSFISCTANGNGEVVPTGWTVRGGSSGRAVGLRATGQGRMGEQGRIAAFT